MVFHYVAQFLQKDEVVGELSDVLVVTVPGKARYDRCQLPGFRCEDA